MRYTCKCVILVLTVLMGGGCGSSSDTRWWESASTTPTSPTTPPSTSVAPRILNVWVEPPALTGGGTAVGTVSLDQAPANDSVVRLTSSDPAASVPASIIVRGGQRQAMFTVTTSLPPLDVRLEVSAASQDLAARTPLDVWAVLPTSFTWSSDANDDIGRGRSDRLTPANASFIARCENSEIFVQVTGAGSRSALIFFGAPRGEALRPGPYTNATRNAFRAPGVPGLDVSVDGTGCNRLNGQFTVTEADLGTRGEIRRFVAIFEQRCENRTSALRGELRLTGPFPLPSFQVSCVR